MAHKFIVDAHALIWHLENNSRLGQNAAAVLDDSSSDLIIPAVALGEACWIVDKGRTTLPNSGVLLDAIEGDARITVEPLTSVIIRRASTLTGNLEMHDRQIVATALVLSEGGDPIPVITRDKAIAGSALVPIIW